MPFDTPPLRVSRPIAACAPCRRTKSKCDGKLPICSACEKSGKGDQCVSSSSDTRETSYVATLETRKAILEKAYADARKQRKAALGLVEASELAASSRQASARDAPRSGKRSDKKTEAVRVDDLVGDFGLMSISATSRDFYGFTPETSYARFVMCSAGKRALLESTAGEPDLPRKEDGARMIREVLFRNLSALPIFDEATVWSAFDNVYADSTAKPAEQYIISILLAIHAAQRGRIGIRSQRSTAEGSDVGSAGDAASYLARGIAYSSQVLRPGSVTSIQALLLLAVYAYLDLAYLDYWTIVGFASRAMVDIGMHHDPSKSSSIPKPSLDARKRVYWCVYALDRLSSIAYRRPFSFSDDSTGVALPSPGGCSASATALFRLRQMQSDFYTALYQPSSVPTYDAQVDPWAYVWRKYSKLGDWLQQSLHQAETAMVAVLELEYCASCAFLLGPSPRCPTPDGHAVTLHRQHSSRFLMLAQEMPDLFYLDALRSMLG